jgi:hypothetical protein
MMAALERRHRNIQNSPTNQKPSTSTATRLYKQRLFFFFFAVVDKIIKSIAHKIQPRIGEPFFPSLIIIHPKTVLLFQDHNTRENRILSSDFRMPSSVHPEDHQEEDQAMVDAEEQQSQQNEEAPSEEQEEVIEMEGGRITVVRRDFSFPDAFLFVFFSWRLPSLACQDT